MRISKIFHWLYASVLLMPIFAIGIKCLYVTFNPNAKDSYYGETINEENTNYFDINNLENNILYNIDYTQRTITNINGYNSVGLIVRSVKDYVNNVEYNNINYLRFFASNNNVSYIVVLSETPTGNNNEFNYQTMNNLVFEYIDTYVVNSDNPWLDMDIFYYTTYNDYSYIDNVFYYSVEQISNESLFNWANNTFLAQPLLFITNLFGVPSTSPIITILCYWFAISVIWLVFDVIMYIPLLVHRWLDKGVIE